MIKNETLNKYNEWKFKLSAYEMALSIIEVDKLTVAPVAGSSYRDARTAFLAGEMFSIMTDPQSAEICRQILENGSGVDGEQTDDCVEVDQDTIKEAELYYNDIMKMLVIPKDEFVAFRNLADNAYDKWHEAKLKSEYQIFEPYLKKIIDAKRKEIEYRNKPESVYDQMLDDYEFGMTMEKYDAFFDKVRERLVPLIKNVTETEQIDDSFLYVYYDPVKQKEWTEKYLLPVLGYTPDWGYQNETEHPFTSGTCINDCRTTTKYLEDNIASSIFSTIHETGHAWYMHDVDEKYDGSILSHGITSGMHESQSRFCENYLGRSLAFWKYLYPSLQEYFPEQLGNITVEQFVKAVNASKPSLIRTEADELTYPLHVLVRYEIEKGLFTGSVSTDGLDKTWNDKYKEVLGVDVPSDKEGILQDVHWSSGDFGYFPTYALGSAFAAQFYKKMREEIDVDALLESGQYTKCIDWLKENIHKYGCRYNADEIMVKATGESFDPEYYIKYLEDKYTTLYSL